MSIIQTLSAMLLTIVGTALLSAETLTIYSARHYDTDKTMYAAFTKATGIEVSVVESKADELVTRIANEGAQCPASVFITVDIGRLHRAADQGFWQSVQSDVLSSKVPAHLRHPDGLWYGFSKRYRLIYVAKDGIDAATVDTYEKLAEAANKGKLLIRSSSNIYNQSLLASLIAHHGEDKALAWAEGMVSNFARKPQSNDTGQLKGLAAGEGEVAVANHYYYLRCLNSDDPEKKAIADAVVPIFPNQGDRGVHVNLSGAGVLKHAPNPEAGKKFLEWLVTPEAQKLFAEANYEVPAVEGVAAKAPFGDKVIKEDTVGAIEIGNNQVKAVELFDAAGWR